MRVGVPGVHAVEDLVALMHGNHGALVQDVQILVGDDRRDLDHAIHLGLKPGHVQRSDGVAVEGDVERRGPLVTSTLCNIAPKLLTTTK